MNRVTGVLSLTLAGLLLAGCASSAPRGGLNSRLIRRAAGKGTPAPSFDAGVPAVKEDSLETVMAKIREISAHAHPAPKHLSGPTIENVDRGLGGALLALTMSPGLEGHLLVAREYARLGVLDAAHKHYRAALAIAPHSAAAYDGLARLWRDARLPWLGLGDARRAVYYAPNSPEARNTLGTVLQALGQDGAARREYETALALAPSAAYALNNLGYLALIEGDTERAIALLNDALVRDGGLRAARHNLALAYAADRRLDLARQALLEAGPPAQAEYNLGIISLAQGRRADALAAFSQACRTDQAQPHACERAAAMHAQGTNEGGTP